MDTKVHAWKLPFSQLPEVVAADNSQLCVSLGFALTKGVNLVPRAAHAQSPAQPLALIWGISEGPAQLQSSPQPWLRPLNFFFHLTPCCEHPPINLPQVSAQLSGEPDLGQAHPCVPWLSPNQWFAPLSLDEDTSCAEISRQLLALGFFCVGPHISSDKLHPFDSKTL